MGTATVICEPSPYPALSQLVKQGKRESTADIYKRSLLNMYNKLDEDVGMSYPFEDVRWLTDKDPILTYLQSIKPSIASARMSAIRGTLKGVSHLYAYWEDKSGTMIEKPPDEPTQSYTPREEKNFASVKVMLDKVHTYDDEIRDMLRVSCTYPSETTLSPQPPTSGCWDPSRSTSIRITASSSWSRRSVRGIAF